MIHLVHLPLDPRAFAAWSGHRNLGTQGPRDDGLALHVLLSSVFGKAVVQPFRLFAPDVGRWSLYAYTAVDAVSLSATAAMVGPPEALAVLPLTELRSKPLPDLTPSLRLGFDLLVRPVRRKMRDTGATERDVFLVRADTALPNELDRADVYRDWLAERLGKAATLVECRLTAFQRRRVIRGGRSVEGPDATLQGTLIVGDVVAFTTLLARGVGRHRAYGYGMLLLRPPGREVVP